jgi:hypothetical protein
MVSAMAKRDMTDKAFVVALERNGFKRWALWAESSAIPGHYFGLLFARNGKLLKRESIAYLIKRRDAELAKPSTRRPRI